MWFSFFFLSFCSCSCQPCAMALFPWVRISLFISLRKGRADLLSARERRCSWSDKWIISPNKLCNATNPTHSQNQRNPSQPGMWHPEVKAPSPAQHTQCHSQAFARAKIQGKCTKLNPCSGLLWLQMYPWTPSSICRVTAPASDFSSSWKVLRV